ncbi:MAG: acyl-CoA dehydrogenase [Alphaproteobacteria bacterium]|nr:MAG: acyl-CoA dehydrogenase [Alphaproteobacteria bacterium]
MSELQSMIFETADRIFADHVTHDLIAKSEAGEAPHDLWRDLTFAGLPKALCSEAAGGIGGTWSDVFGIIKAAGARAVPLPLGEIMAAHWLAEQAGLAVPEDAIAVFAAASGPEPGVTVQISLESSLPTHLVAWDEAARTLSLAVLKEADSPRSIAGARQLSLHITDQEIIEIAPLDLPGMSPLALGAMLRAAQMAGAMEAALRLSVDYVNERVQFGRPIGKFQAIQQQLAMMSGHVAAAARAAQVAFETNSAFDIACAKLIAGEAAEVVTDVAHQVHGAIGFTYEYQLQFLTRRLWSWGSEFGATAYWAERVGGATLATGPDAVWSAITENRLVL